MPNFDITIDGKTYHVEVPDPGASPLQVIVDGQPFDVSIAGVETSAEPRVKLAEPPRPAPAPAQLPTPPEITVARPVMPAGAHVGTSIVSPMPGTLLSINVTIGQAVESGQVVCILEAMKMKNPIRASQAGVVAEIVVQAGQTVAYGDLLVKLV